MVYPSKSEEQIMWTYGVISSVGLFGLVNAFLCFYNNSKYFWR